MMISEPFIRVMVASPAPDMEPAAAPSCVGLDYRPRPMRPAVGGWRGRLQEESERERKESARARKEGEVYAAAAGNRLTVGQLGRGRCGLQWRSVEVLHVLPFHSPWRALSAPQNKNPSAKGTG